MVLAKKVKCEDQELFHYTSLPSHYHIIQADNENPRSPSSNFGQSSKLRSGLLAEKRVSFQEQPLEIQLKDSTTEVPNLLLPPTSVHVKKDAGECSRACIICQKLRRDGVDFRILTYESLLTQKSTSNCSQKKGKKRVAFHERKTHSEACSSEPSDLIRPIIKNSRTDCEMKLLNVTHGLKTIIFQTMEEFSLQDSSLVLDEDQVKAVMLGEIEMVFDKLLRKRRGIDEASETEIATLKKLNEIYNSNGKSAIVYRRIGRFIGAKLLTMYEDIEGLIESKIDFKGGSFVKLGKRKTSKSDGELFQRKRRKYSGRTKQADGSVKRTEHLQKSACPLGKSLSFNVKDDTLENDTDDEYVYEYFNNEQRSSQSLVLAADSVELLLQRLNRDGCSTPTNDESPAIRNIEVVSTSDSKTVPILKAPSFDDDLDDRKKSPQKRVSFKEIKEAKMVKFNFENSSAVKKTKRKRQKSAGKPILKNERFHSLRQKCMREAFESNSCRAESKLIETTDSLDMLVRPNKHKFV